MSDAGPRTMPWRLIVVWALVGTLAGAGLAWLDLSRTSDTNGGLIHTGPTGPASALIAEDFPDEPQSRYGEHDGPMFYAIARAPMHLDEVSASLDRPRYRLQHPLFAWLAWLVHPTGGGDGLLRAMVVVGVLAMLLGAVAMSALSVTLRGPPWLGMLFPVLPGAVMSLRITVGDALAVALVLVAVTLFLRGHLVVATSFGILAVLTKEPMLLTLAAVALWRRDRSSSVFVGAPVLVAAAWALWLRVAVDSPGGEVIEFSVPFRGLAGAARWWIDGESPYAMLAVLAAVVLAVIVLVRRAPSHPLWWAVLVNLGFLLLLDRDVIGLERNGSRMSLVLIVLAIVALATPAAPGRNDLVAARRATTDAI